MCLSLALCNVPAPTEYVIFLTSGVLRRGDTHTSGRLKWIYTAYDELIQTWCFAEDLESYEHAAMEAVNFTFGCVRSIFLLFEMELTNRWILYRKPFTTYAMMSVAPIVLRTQRRLTTRI